MQAGFELRPYTKDDINFICSSWGTSYYKGSQSHKFISPEEFHFFHRPLRDRFFLRPSATVVICSNTEDPTHILGWIALEKDWTTEHIQRTILHYIYVKDALRAKGIATELLTKTIPQNSHVIYTHKTSQASALLKIKPQLFLNYNYQPHLT